MPAPNEMTQSNLAALIGTSKAPILLDVCLDEDFAEDPRLIPTACRCSHENIVQLAPELSQERIVVVCQKGLKLSQGAAALLRSEGVLAHYLQGGMADWAAAKLPLIPAEALVGNSDLWAVSERPHPQALACCWLIKRFISRRAKLLFVAADQVENVADRFNATALPIDRRPGHHQRGLTIFDALVTQFCLGSAPLRRLNATLADKGVLAALSGLLLQTQDDLQVLDQAMVLFDGLFAWAKAEAADV